MMHGVKSDSNKEVKQYWIVMVSIEGFESVMLMYGTQTEMWEYVRNTLSYKAHYRYRSASDDDVAAAKKLGIKVYLC